MVNTPQDADLSGESSAATGPDVSAGRLKYEALTQRLEQMAVANPTGYNRRVAALAMLGYAYIFGVLLACLALIGGLVWLVIFSHRFNAGFLKIGFFLLVFAFIIVKSLFVKIEPPEGRELTRDEAPQLFAHVDEIGEQLNAPRPHHVLLTDEFNAAVAQIPRFGIFGGHRNYLIVGLQLMSALSPEEFKSVLAHEFGHLSANHSKFSGRIYRVRRIWMNLMEQFSEGSNLIFGPFFNWYAPYFGAYSFVLARQNEYVADRCAAEVCTPRVAAGALTRGAVVGGYLFERVWPEVFKSAGREPQPPADVYSRVRGAINAPLEPATVNRWLSEAINRPTDLGDTHPSLTQRLTSMKQEPQLAPRDGQSAAEFYLGENLGELTQQMDAQWHEGIAPAWSERYREMEETREKLEAIEAKTEPLTDDEQWLRADATEDFGDETRALELFRQYLESHPDEARAHFAVGRLMLAQSDENGLAHLQRALELEHQATLPACQLAETFLLQRGHVEAAAGWRERGLRYGDKLDFAQAERNSLKPKDTLLPPDLPAEEIEKLRAHFAAHPLVSEVYLVRKEVQHFPETPLYVLGVEMQKKKLSISGDFPARQQAFAAAMQNLEFQHEALYLLLDSDAGKPFVKPLRKVQDSLIYASGTN